MPAARTPRARGVTAIPMMASTPAARIAQRSAGYHCGLQPRRTNAQAAVAPMARQRAMRGNQRDPVGARGYVPPMPTSAPTAGARTTV